MGLSPGVTLGPYEILAPLGAGAMGEVYRASDPRLRREVAIKVLPAAFATDPARLRRFEQEALAAASLNHPNILAVHDIGLHDGSPYIVSELLEGGTLRDTLAGGALPVRKALDYAAQMAQGLAAAHDKGIVHRDLKPENVFVTRDGRIKILDFGLAKLTQVDAVSSGGSAQLTAAAGTEPGMIVGTVGYMSPEQVRGEPADHRSDIFAFAVILFEMLDGRRPFQGPSAVETMHAILKEDPPPFTDPASSVPPAVERLVRRCLEKHPEQRFQSARDLAFNLEVPSTESAASRVAAAPALPRQSRTKFLPAVAVGLLLVVAAAAGFLLARSLAGPASPTFTRLTFRRGTVQSARFAPDGQTIVYSAAWQGNPAELFSTRVGNVEARSLGATGASVLSISSTGEMALRLANGTLARAPLAGGAPREVIERVTAAAWTPDGQALAIVRVEGGRRRLEYPAGTVLYETAGLIPYIAMAPDGSAIALAEAAPGITTRLSIGLVEIGGSKRTLSDDWGDVRGLAWSPKGDEIWFAGSKTQHGTGTVYALTRGGKRRDVFRVPADLYLFDVFAGGRALVGRGDNRLETRGLAPNETQERDLSWFDYSGISDLSTDGRTLIITENGETGFHMYSRKTDGSPAVPLGEGGSFGLSPDGRSLIVTTTVGPPRLSIAPMGPGDARVIPNPEFESFAWANWFPDGQRILIAAAEKGHRLRLYVEGLDGSGRRPIAAEGITINTGSHAVSPDGRLVAASANGRTVLVPVDGGDPRPLPGVEPGELPSRWSPDGRFLYVYRRDRVPTHVYRVDVATGAKELWKDIGPPDTAGVGALGHLIMTPDTKSYVYNYPRAISDLYLAEGVR